MPSVTFCGALYPRGLHVLKRSPPSAHEICCFFHTEHRFCVKEPQTRYLRLFRLGYLKGILWKINEMALSLQGKVAAFVVSVKSELPMRLSAS